MHKNSRPQQILKWLLAGGGILVVSVVAPRAGARLVQNLIKVYFRKKRFERERFLQDLRRLQVRKLVRYEEAADGNIKIILTKRGKQEVLRFNLDELQLDTKKPWDGLWRLVMFDIPHHKKQARDALREKLSALRFYPLQKSVFLTPYECEKEIDFICSIFGVREHLLILYVKEFEGEEKFRHHFSLV